MNVFLRLFGYTLEKATGPNQVALALCNCITPTAMHETPVVISHAHCIDGTGLVRIFTRDGKQYTARIREA